MLTGSAVVAQILAMHGNHLHGPSWHLDLWQWLESEKEKGIVLESAITALQQLGHTVGNSRHPINVAATTVAAPTRTLR